MSWARFVVELRIVNEKVREEPWIVRLVVEGPVQKDVICWRDREAAGGTWWKQLERITVEGSPLFFVGREAAEETVLAWIHHSETAFGPGGGGPAALLVPYSVRPELPGNASIDVDSHGGGVVGGPHGIINGTFSPFVMSAPFLGEPLSLWGDEEGDVSIALIQFVEGMVESSFEVEVP